MALSAFDLLAVTGPTPRHETRTPARQHGSIHHASSSPGRPAEHTQAKHSGFSPGWLAVALIYFGAATLTHLQISLWIVKKRSGANGEFAIKDFMPEVALVGAALLLGWLAFKAWKAPRAWPDLALWLLLGVCVGLVDRFLTLSAPEYAHYPQFALLAWLLARAGPDTLTTHSRQDPVLDDPAGRRRRAGPVPLDHDELQRIPGLQ